MELIPYTILLSGVFYYLRLSNIKYLIGFFPFNGYDEYTEHVVLNVKVIVEFAANVFAFILFILNGIKRNWKLLCLTLETQKSWITIDKEIERQRKSHTKKPQINHAHDWRYTACFDGILQV